CLFSFRQRWSLAHPQGVIVRRAGGVSPRSQVGREPPEGASEGCHREDYWVQLLKIPQLCKVKTNGRGIIQSAGLYLLDEPSETAIHRLIRPTLGSRLAGPLACVHGQGGKIYQHLDGQGGLLDA